MNIIIQPSTIKGSVTAPPSKSAMQRACAAALIRKGASRIYNPGNSNDDKAALNIIRQLGAEWKWEEDHLHIDSIGIQAKSNIIDCGESGLAARMFTPIAALIPDTLEITGSGSLKSRPMHFFEEVLPQLDVTINANEGRLPFHIQGPLQARNITVDGALSSQYLTGLLMAYSAGNASDVTIKVTDLTSKPYIDLTLQMMEHFGLKVPAHHNYETFYFDNTTAKSSANTISYKVEGDWSGAAFLMVASAIAGPVTIKGLDVFSVQADKAVLQVLMDSGCHLSIQQEQIDIKPGKLKAFHFDATHCPDLFPPLVALAAYCEGTCVIEGIHRLIHKESNRALTLQEEFDKMGVAIQFQDDLMLIKGNSNTHAAIIDSHNDHRIAMACAVAALKADGPVQINDADAVSKSYPEFYQHLEQLGVKLIKA